MNSTHARADKRSLRAPDQTDFNAVQHQLNNAFRPSRALASAVENRRHVFIVHNPRPLLSKGTRWTSRTLLDRGELERHWHFFGGRLLLPVCLGRLPEKSSLTAQGVF
jgi:hypothetical protein